MTLGLSWVRRGGCHKFLYRQNRLRSEQNTKAEDPHCSGRSSASIFHVAFDAYAVVVAQ
jgi:hypothetical protein